MTKFTPLPKVLLVFMAKRKLLPMWRVIKSTHNSENLQTVFMNFVQECVFDITIIICNRIELVYNYVDVQVYRTFARVFYHLF